MKNLVYGSSPILVSDDVADAVVHYASILATGRLSDVVAIPTVTTMGLPSKTHVVLAPGIPVMSEEAPDDVLETPDPLFVEDLRQRVLEVLATAEERAARE